MATKAQRRALAKARAVKAAKLSNVKLQEYVVLHRDVGGSGPLRLATGLRFAQEKAALKFVECLGDSFPDREFYVAVA